MEKISADKQNKFHCRSSSGEQFPSPFQASSIFSEFSLNRISETQSSEGNPELALIKYPLQAYGDSSSESLIFYLDTVSKIQKSIENLKDEIIEKSNEHQQKVNVLTDLTSSLAHHMPKDPIKKISELNEITDSLQHENQALKEKLSLCEENEFLSYLKKKEESDSAENEIEAYQYLLSLITKESLFELSEKVDLESDELVKMIVDKEKISRGINELTALNISEIEGSPEEKIRVEIKRPSQYNIMIENQYKEILRLASVNEELEKKVAEKLGEIEDLDKKHKGSMAKIKELKNKSLLWNQISSKFYKLIEELREKRVKSDLVDNIQEKLNLITDYNANIEPTESNSTFELKQAEFLPQSEKPSKDSFINHLVRNPALLEYHIEQFHEEIDQKEEEIAKIKRELNETKTRLEKEMAKSKIENFSFGSMPISSRNPRRKVQIQSKKPRFSNFSENESEFEASEILENSSLENFTPEMKDLVEEFEKSLYGKEEETFCEIAKTLNRFLKESENSSENEDKNSLIETLYLRIREKDEKIANLEASIEILQEEFEGEKVKINHLEEIIHESKQKLEKKNIETLKKPLISSQNIPLLELESENSLIYKKQIEILYETIKERDTTIHELQTKDKSFIEQTEISEHPLQNQPDRQDYLKFQNNFNRLKKKHLTPLILPRTRSIQPISKPHPLLNPLYSQIQVFKFETQKNRKYFLEISDQLKARDLEISSLYLQINSKERVLKDSIDLQSSVISYIGSLTRELIPLSDLIPPSYAKEEILKTAKSLEKMTESPVYQLEADLKTYTYGELLEINEQLIEKTLKDSNLIESERLSIENYEKEFEKLFVGLNLVYKPVSSKLSRELLIEKYYKQRSKAKTLKRQLAEALVERVPKNKSNEFDERTFIPKILPESLESHYFEIPTKRVSYEFKSQKTFSLKQKLEKILKIIAKNLQEPDIESNLILLGSEQSAPQAIKEKLSATAIQIRDMISLLEEHMISDIETSNHESLEYSRSNKNFLYLKYSSKSSPIHSRDELVENEEGSYTPLSEGKTCGSPRAIEALKTRLEGIAAIPNTKDTLEYRIEKLREEFEIKDELNDSCDSISSVEAESSLPVAKKISVRLLLYFSKKRLNSLHRGLSIWKQIEKPVLISFLPRELNSTVLESPGVTKQDEIIMKEAIIERMQKTVQESSLTRIYSENYNEPMQFLKIFKILEDILESKHEADLISFENETFPSKYPEHVLEYFFNNYPEEETLERFLSGLYQLTEEQHPYSIFFSCLLQVFHPHPISYYLSVYLTRLNVKFKELQTKTEDLKENLYSKMRALQKEKLNDEFERAGNGGFVFTKDLLDFIYENFDKQAGIFIIERLCPSSITLKDYFGFLLCHKLQFGNKTPLEILSKLNKRKGVGVTVYDIIRISEGELDLWVSNTFIFGLFQNCEMKQSEFCRWLNIGGYIKNSVNLAYKSSKCSFFTVIVEYFNTQTVRDGAILYSMVSCSTMTKNSFDVFLADSLEIPVKEGNLEEIFEVISEGKQEISSVEACLEIMEIGLGNYGVKAFKVPELESLFLYSEIDEKKMLLKRGRRKTAQKYLKSLKSKRLLNKSR